MHDPESDYTDKKKIETFRAWSHRSFFEKAKRPLANFDRKRHQIRI